MIQIKLRKDFYFSAGNKYGWEGAGVGIAMSKLDSNDIIRIVNPKRGTYLISSSKARDLIKQYNSTETRGQTILGIIPINCLKQIK